MTTRRLYIDVKKSVIYVHLLTTSTNNIRAFFQLVALLGANEQHLLNSSVLTKFEPKTRENLHSLFGPRSQSIGRGRISREGALDHRESRERRDKIFAAKTVKRQNFQKKNGSGKQFSVQEIFIFLATGKPTFLGWGITSKLAS